MEKYLRDDVLPAVPLPFPFPLPFVSGNERYWPFATLGFSVALGRLAIFCFEGLNSLSRTSEDKVGRGSLVMSWDCQTQKVTASLNSFVLSYLERLCIPILHLLDRRHFVQLVRQVPKLLYTMRQPYGEFFGEELGCTEQCP